MKRFRAFLRSALSANSCGFSTTPTGGNTRNFFISVAWKLLRVPCSFLIIQVVPKDPHWDQGLSQPGLWPCGKTRVLSVQASGKTGLEWAQIIKVCKQMMMGKIHWNNLHDLWGKDFGRLGRAIQYPRKQQNIRVIYSWHMECVSSWAVCE